MVDVTMVIPFEFNHLISKKNVRDKRVEFWGANWERASMFCKEEGCGWQHIAPNPKWLDELEELRAKVKELEGGKSE